MTAVIQFFKKIAPSIYIWQYNKCCKCDRWRYKSKKTALLSCALVLNKSFKNVTCQDKRFASSNISIRNLWVFKATTQFRTPLRIHALIQLPASRDPPVFFFGYCWYVFDLSKIMQTSAGAFCPNHLPVERAFNYESRYNEVISVPSRTQMAADIRRELRHQVCN